MDDDVREQVRAELAKRRSIVRYRIPILSVAMVVGLAVCGAPWWIVTVWAVFLAVGNVLAVRRYTAIVAAAQNAGYDEPA